MTEQSIVFTHAENMEILLDVVFSSMEINLIPRTIVTDDKGTTISIQGTPPVTLRGLNEKVVANLVKLLTKNEELISNSKAARMLQGLQMNCSNMNRTLYKALYESKAIDMAALMEVYEAQADAYNLKDTGMVKQCRELAQQIIADAYHNLVASNKGTNDV